MNFSEQPIGRKQLLLAVILALILPFLASLAYFVVLKDGASARLVYGCTKVFIIVWPLIACRYILRAKPTPFMVRPSVNTLCSGVVSGLILSISLLLLMFTPWGEVVFSSLGKIKEKVITLGVVDHYVLFAVFLSFIHSFIEEYYWRWFVFGGLALTLKSRNMAHVVAAIGFALHHIVVATQYFPFGYGLFFGSFVGIGGFVWSKLYDQQQNLFGAWISHVVVDIVIMTTGYILLFP